MSDLAIRHDPQAGRFACGHPPTEAVCDYHLLVKEGGTVMALVHTLVPPALQGQGLAARLVQAAMDHARAQGWRVRPVCSYVHTFLARNPQARDLLEQP